MRSFLSASECPGSGSAARFLLFLAPLVLCVNSAVADELAYKPVNPSFGGNPFNGPYLLSNAGAQRQFNAPERRRPAIDEFSDDMQRALLGQISRQIADQILGENARDNGTFTVGDTHIDFHREGSQVVIDVQDIRTGGATTIELPVPQY